MTDPRPQRRARRGQGWRGRDGEILWGVLDHDTWTSHTIQRAKKSQKSFKSESDITDLCILKVVPAAVWWPGLLGEADAAGQGSTFGEALTQDSELWELQCG